MAQDPALQALEEGDFQRILEDRGKFWVAFIGSRPRVREWLEALEKTHYTPASEANGNLTVVVEKCFTEVLGGAIPLLWVSVPLEDAKKVLLTLQEFDLQVETNRYLVVGYSPKFGPNVTLLSDFSQSGLDSFESSGGRVLGKSRLIAHYVSSQMEIGVGFRGS
ncbi:hypothetical protein COY33_02100 [candidate division WWE3 bacterium CG_4_10_14_0_2_um_filter_42_7]|uniref:Uncharacterized protein n=1 Tax=candidate division WWE3 bacterium CG_4_10_14_0_2_um_filter_42_7 TaxID=1975073 RepID=A0A2M7TCQ5_UNCKA|nr:MAG: hypothetical protein COY33_02100 [candidate division WWE3 bacterium CG_4_10_14_0_2_um_filter_42_7]